ERYVVCYLFMFVCVFFVFFFSSRRRHTRSKRDWSSDVCSSDLLLPTLVSTHRAAELLLFGERFGAEAARDLDSVNPVVADADLLATAKAQQLAQKPPRAL